MLVKDRVIPIHSSNSVFFNLFQFEEPLEKFLITYSTILSIFREPRKELAELLGSAGPRLKNTALVPLMKCLI